MRDEGVLIEDFSLPADERKRIRSALRRAMAERYTDLELEALISGCEAAIAIARSVDSTPDEPTAVERRALKRASERATALRDALVDLPPHLAGLFPSLSALDRAAHFADLLRHVRRGPKRDERVYVLAALLGRSFAGVTRRTELGEPFKDVLNECVRHVSTRADLGDLVAYARANLAPQLPNSSEIASK